MSPSKYIALDSAEHSSFQGVFQANMTQDKWYVKNPFNV